MINTPSLRLRRHAGEFGDFPCGCKLCRNKREQDKDIFWGRIATIVFFILFIFGVCTIAQADTLQASWYSKASLIKEGTWKNGETMMANGKRFDENALTCATRLYPLGTMLLVTNLDNNKTVLVKVTDRIGKRFAKTRIDLSKAAFSKIASLDKGLVDIKVNKVVIGVKS